ncbi:dihydrofolate reductase family protein, partial [Nostoc sp. CHAB 5714]|nr:dihydrofolate reductase family protein [Nostoc favosum CHAB5714]
HVLRARSDAILVGRGTLQADAPGLDVRLPGLEDRSPPRVLLSATAVPGDGWTRIASPQDVGAVAGNWLLVEGGMATAAAFLAADLVDTLVIYQAPIVIGGGMTLGDIGLADLSAAHGRWRLADSRLLGSDRLSIYRRVRE